MDVGLQTTSFTEAHFHRVLPFGAEIVDGGVHFRIFAPAAAQVRLRLPDAGRELPMETSGNGWHEITTNAAGAGTHYRYVLPDGTAVADPAARFQPEDADGPSEVIDAATYTWQQTAWRGRPWEQTVLYELHVGTFTPEGSFAAAAARMPHLAAAGITAIEMMCLADFAGARNWGYDTVLWFAPDSRYGRPEELKALVDAAHSNGIQVVLDVVYNHFGPQGNDMPKYFPQMLTDRHCTPWGNALNFDGGGDEDQDGDCARVVRELVIQNALYWIEEYRIDGLRLDAAHAIIDHSRTHVLDELIRRVHELAAEQGRHVHLIREDEQSIADQLLRNDAGTATRYTAQWNHDMSHLLGAAMRQEFPDGAKDEETAKLGKAIAEGFVIAAEESGKGDEQRCKVPPTAFIAFVQTHDLIGNRIAGERIHALAPLPAVRAAMSLLLLAPQVPMVFMGDEWAAMTPFPYFCDFGGELGEAVRRGRCEFLEKLHHASPEELKAAPNPQAKSTFLSAKLQWDEASEGEHAAWLEWYPCILRTRLERVAPLLGGLKARCGTSRVLGAGALEIEWTLAECSKLAVAANLRAGNFAGFSEALGETIWLEGSAVSGTELGAWSVRWSVG